MNKVTRIHTHGNTFEIVKNNDGILCAINHKYLDESGCLNKQLDGFDMFVSTIDNTLSGMINRITKHFEWLEFVEKNRIDTSNETELLTAIKIFYNL